MSREQPRRRIGEFGPGALLAAAVAIAVFYDGGFSAAPRTLFAGLALAALAWTIAVDGRAAGRAAREPVVIVLFALGALGSISALWAVGFAADAVRWGLVTIGYGAVALSAAVLARRAQGIQAIAACICVAAFISGLVGLGGAALYAGPVADRIGGSWRPGGTLEYSGALALLQVSALPGLLGAMCSRRAGLRIAAAMGAAVAASVLALAVSRTGLAFAALICIAAVAVPHPTVGGTVRGGRPATRPMILGAVLLLATAGAAAQLIAGGYAAPRADPGIGRAIGLVAVIAVTALAWLATGPLWGRRVRAGAGAGVVLVSLFAVMGAAAATGVAAQSAAQRSHGIEPSSGFLHGRPDTWRAALDTFEDHPWGGAGAGSFLAASARHQDHGPVRFAHSLPLELAVELGLGGAILAIALYAAALRAFWRARLTPAAWLLGPAMLGFLAASLLDWPWHLAGSGAIWALALGGLIAAGLGKEPQRA